MSLFSEEIIIESKGKSQENFTHNFTHRKRCGQNYTTNHFLFKKCYLGS